jgi:hypothetical protein
MLERGSVQLADLSYVAGLVPNPPTPPFIGLYAVTVASLGDTRSYFAAHGLQARHEERMLIVPFPEALGQGAWVFVETARDLPWRDGT